MRTEGISGLVRLQTLRHGLRKSSDSPAHLPSETAKILLRMKY
jgi:hypothetical protein